MKGHTEIQLENLIQGGGEDTANNTHALSGAGLFHPELGDLVLQKSDKPKTNLQSIYK